MPQQPAPVTYAQLVHIFTTQLTISIHTILASRGIYPPHTFINARAYNLPVQQSRHSGVCTWINDAVAAVEAELLKGTVARVALVIFEAGWENNSGTSDELNKSSESDLVTVSKPKEKKDSPPKPNKTRLMERYVWDVSHFPVISKSDLHTPFIRPPTSSGSDVQSAALGGGSAHDTEPMAPEQQRAEFQEKLKQLHSDMHEQFRGLLSRLSTISSSLAPLPKSTECTFTVCVELKEESDPPIGHPQVWIPSEKGAQRTIMHRSADEETREETEDVAARVREKEGGRLIDRGRDLGGTRTTPVRTVDQGEMIFEMWIEEGKAKFEEQSSVTTRENQSKGV